MRKRVASVRDVLDTLLGRGRGAVRIDANGAWAARGRVEPALLEAFLAEPYFAVAPPKSTGRELFHRAWLDTQLAGLGACTSMTMRMYADRKSLPLERIYRDSRCGSLMLPWTAELCLDRIGREALYEAGESDD